MEDKEEIEERGRPLQIGRLQFKPAREFTRIVLDDLKTSRSPHWPARILRVYTENLTVFSHVCSSDGLNHTLLSQNCILGTATSMGTVGRKYIPRIGEDVRNL